MAGAKATRVLRRRIAISVTQGWFGVSSWLVEIGEVADVVDFHVHLCFAQFTSIREEPVDQLVVAVGSRNGRVIVEDGMVLSDEPDVTERATSGSLPSSG